MMQLFSYHKKTKVLCKIRAKIFPISKNNKLKASQSCKYKKNNQKIVKKKNEKNIIWQIIIS